MNLPLWIAGRLSLKPQNKKKRSPGVTIAVAGFAIAIAIMMIAIAIVMGFKNSIKDKLLGLESAVTISLIEQNPETNNTYVPSEELISNIRKDLPDGVSLSTTLNATALLKTSEDYLGVFLRGNEPGSPQEEYIRENLIEGTYPDYASGEDDNKIVVSATAARLLKLKPGDKTYLHFFVDGNVKTRPAIISGIYDTSFSERDKLLAFASPNMISKVYKLPEGSATTLNVAGKINESDIEELSQQLQSTLLQEYYSGKTSQILDAQPVRRRAAMYFNWLDLLDTNVVVIIVLMGLVSGFTLISCLLILILERIQMIGILKSLGATDAMIRKIFLAMAMKIVLLGLVIGNVTGLGLLLLQKHTHLIPLDPEAYFLDSVPVEIIPWQMAALNVGAVILAGAILILPTSIISTISPATTVRYE